jgi:hypothetical protein
MKFLLIALPAVLFCCASKKEGPNQLKAKYFKDSFIKKFKKYDPPCSVEHNPTFKGISTIFVDQNSMDTLFFGQAPISWYGMVSDSSNFYTLFTYMHGAVTPIPMIETFDKSGKFIDSEQIDFGCWGGGAPYEYTCEGGYVLNKDFTISLYHETIVTDCVVCDSTEIFPRSYAYQWKGRILNNGTIEMENRPNSPK